jgi:hypothetical protein
MKNNMMTDTQKTNYLRISLALARVGVDNQMAEMIWRTYEGLIQKEGKFSLEDQIAVELMVQEHFAEKNGKNGKDKKKNKKDKKEVVNDG